jgi:DNA invertase Pin-like site-specific DNA recombinase
MTSQATETTGNENAVASLFATISRLSPQYHVLANANSDQVESVLDRSRRREQLQEKDIAKIFSLKYNGGCPNTQIARVMNISDVTVYHILKRKHKLSANWPKHEKET